MVSYQNKVTTGHMHLGRALRSYFYYQAEKNSLLQVRNPLRELPQHPEQVATVTEPNCTVMQRKDG